MIQFLTAFPAAGLTVKVVLFLAFRAIHGVVVAFESFEARDTSAFKPLRPTATQGRL